MKQVVNNNIYLPRGESETLAWELLTNTGTPWINTINWLDGITNDYNAKEVTEGADLASFPATGALGVYYYAIDTEKYYLWQIDDYIEVSEPTVFPVTGVAGEYYRDLSTDFIYTYDTSYVLTLEDPRPQLDLKFIISSNINSSRNTVLDLDIALSEDDSFYLVFDTDFDTTNIITSSGTPSMSADLTDSDEFLKIRTLYAHRLTNTSTTYYYGYFITEIENDVVTYVWTPYYTPTISFYFKPEYTINLDIKTYIYEIFLLDGDATKRTVMTPHDFKVGGTTYGR